MKTQDKIKEFAKEKGILKSDVSANEEEFIEWLKNKEKTI